MSKKLDRLYIRVDALFHRDERYLGMPYALRDSAHSLFLLLNGWSRDKKTDGRVPEAVAIGTGLSMEHPRKRVEAMLAALLKVGLLVRDGADLIIPKYEKWQDTKEEIERHSAAGRTGGKASGAKRKGNDSEASVNGSSTNRSASRERIVNDRSSQTETEIEIETVVTPPVAPPRVQELQRGCQALLKRPLRGDERAVLMGWSALQRDGTPVPIAEVLGLVGHLLAKPARDGTLPGTLRYCDATVTALARAPWASAGPSPPSNGALADPELIREPTAEERASAARALPGLRAAIDRLSAGMALEGDQ